MTKARTNADNASADIQGVTAGTGLSGGGTSGTVTITNEMATTITAKGDLLAGTGNAAFDNLAAGNNGETLVADSSATTGLRWQGDYAAGKNKIINGDFGIWQRGTSFSNPANETYLCDRFKIQYNGTGSSRVFSQQTFTPGTAPVAGYEGQYFARLAITTGGTGGTYMFLSQPIEDVRTYAGQTVTLSYWARVSSGTINIQPNLQQLFGAGGSGEVPNTFAQNTITTTWTRYTSTVTVASIAGKTIGTGSNLRFSFNLPENTAYTLDLWGVQVEAGSVATAFQTATGTLAGELALAQRYYWRIPGTNNIFYAGFNNSTTEAYSAIPLPVTMRVRPTTTVTSAATNLAVRISGGTNVASNGTTAIIGNTTQNIWFSTTVASGLTAGQGSALVNLGSAEAIEMSAEL